MKPHLFVVILLAFIVAETTGQTSFGRLTVQSVPGGAEVYVNKKFVGNTPLQDLKVESGSVHVRVVYPSARAWNAIEKVDTLFIHEGQSTLFEADLGVTLSLNSVPAGAAVMSNSLELGRTPLFWRGSSLRDLVLTKEGHEEEVVSISHLVKSAPLVRMKPDRFGVVDPEVLSPSSLNGGADRLPVYLSASAMILSGITAAYLKDKADREFEMYVRTLNPASRVSTQRLDRQSGIAFTVTQISFAALAYFLLLE